jgi:serine/threonine protein kinase
LESLKNTGIGKNIKFILGTLHFIPSQSLRNYKHYEPIAPIGKGNFSKVVSAKHVPTGKEYAVKVMTHSMNKVSSF